jgi:hypothetical protein
MRIATNSIQKLSIEPCEIADLFVSTICIIHSQSNCSRTNPLNPLYVAPDRRKILVSILRDEHHILDPDASNPFIAF